MCGECFQHIKNGDFDVVDSIAVEKVWFSKMQIWRHLLNQDLCQTHEELVGSLGVTQQAISKHLKVMGMIQKQENRVLYEFNTIDVKQHFDACATAACKAKMEGISVLHCHWG